MANDLITQKVNSLHALLESSKKDIEMALPRHLTPERMLRIALTECRKNPALLDCSQASFLGAIIQTAQLGLETGSALGHAYLIPFNNKKLGTKEVQFIVGYRGMLDLAGRSPKVSRVIARAVYEGDKFSHQFGTDEKIEHIPDPTASGSNITHVYAILFLKEGGSIFDVMHVNEIENIRKRSKSPDSGPWDSDYEAMAKKTVVRRLFKFMPVSIELQTAIGMDEAAERGEQLNADIIPTTVSVVSENKTSDLERSLENKTNKTQTSQDQPATFKSFSEQVKPSKKQTRTELAVLATTEMKRTGVSESDIATECATRFNKNMKQISDDELSELIEELKKLPNGENK
jgi:recombination protein RecT